MTAAPQYDIDVIRAKAGSPAEVLYLLWESIIRTDRETWHAAERVAVDSWSFDSTMGNGIYDLVTNENYEVIANGLHALNLLDEPRLQAFSTAIGHAFSSHGVEVTNGSSIQRMELLPDEARAALETALRETEMPFLDEIWHQGTIISAITRHIDLNLHIFEKRKEEQSAADNSGAAEFP
jgi:hypothetical protein